jgi:hypothetical protein
MHPFLPHHKPRKLTVCDILELQAKLIMSGQKIFIRYLLLGPLLLSSPVSHALSILTIW